MVAEKVRDYRGLDTMRLTGLIVDAITTWHPDYVVLLGERRRLPFSDGARTRVS